MSAENQEQKPDTPRPSRTGLAEERVGTLTRHSDGQEFPLGFGSLRVGRQRRADLIIPEKTVSRHHADICYESGRYVLYDHSTNGTWVNDRLVAVAQPLRDSDRVKFGEAEFTFHLKPMSRDAAARPDERLSTRAGKWSTLLMKGGKSPRRQGRIGRVLIPLVLLLIVVAAVIYFFFPDLVGRILG